MPAPAPELAVHGAHELPHRELVHVALEALLERLLGGLGRLRLPTLATLAFLRLRGRQRRWQRERVGGIWRGVRRRRGGAGAWQGEKEEMEQDLDLNPVKHTTRV